MAADKCGLQGTDCLTDRDNGNNGELRKKTLNSSESGRRKRLGGRKAGCRVGELRQTQ